MVTHSEFAIIQNFGTAEIDPSTVDALLREVADVLGVTLDRSVRKVRIVVTSPENITGLALAINSTPSGKVSALSGGRYVEALYLPKASIALIPYFDRVILGHELAHYVTDHYLTQTPLAQWEAIADRVEHKLWMAKPTPPSPAPPPPSVALVEDASREQDVLPTEDGKDWLEPDLVALPVGASPGEPDASVPGPQAHSVDEFAAVVAVPLAEGEGQARADEVDGRADALLVQAPQRL
jgi:hypothetical protein